MDKCKKGFTLVEVLIVISIIAVLAIIALMSIFGQMAHATDANRKSDLYNLSKSFEDYFNDRSAFPNQSVVNDCGGALAPYIPIIPCDPVHRTDHYGYFPAINGGYRICAKLTDTTDPAIAAAGCSGPDGCGLGGPASGGVYNYCLSSGVTASAVGTVDEISSGVTPIPGGGGTPTPGGGGGGGGGGPTPTPGRAINNWACTPGVNPITGKGICNWYYDPSGPPPLGGNCPVSWLTCPTNNECDNPANRCRF